MVCLYQRKTEKIIISCNTLFGEKECALHKMEVTVKKARISSLHYIE